MWRFHSVHHSPEHMDWVSGFRVHPFDGVVIAPAFFFLLGAGFGAEVAGVLAVVQVDPGPVLPRQRPGAVEDPRSGRREPRVPPLASLERDDAVGHNYGPASRGGTWSSAPSSCPSRSAGRRPARYGVSEPLPPNLLGQLTHPCRGVRRHLWLWRHPMLFVKTVAVATRNLFVDIRRSALRPTHSIRREASPGVFTTNASLLGPGAVPKPTKRALPGHLPPATRSGCG